MTALWIILGVLAALIAVIVVLLHFSVKAYVKADKKGLDLVVKYLGFTVYKLNLPQKEEKAPEPSELSADDISLSEIPRRAPSPPSPPTTRLSPKAQTTLPLKKNPRKNLAAMLPMRKKRTRRKSPPRRL